MEKQSYYLSKYIPNFITILSLCCGLTSIRFARKFKEGSYLGAELDSLSDFISFGVAPSLLIFYWSLSELKSLGWSISLFFAICAALRLARFTADIYLTSKPIDPSMYFVGVSSPAAAGLSLLPLFIFFEFDFSFIQNEYLNLCNLSIIGFLMVSKIPTMSLKNINFSKKTRPWILLLIAIICIGLISNLWLTLIFITITYIASIFYTVFINLRTKN